MHVACQYAQAEMMHLHLPDPEHHPTPPIQIPLQAPAGITCQSSTDENRHEWIQYQLPRGTIIKIEFVPPSFRFGDGHLIKIGIRIAEDCLLLLITPLAWPALPLFAIGGVTGTGLSAILGCHTAAGPDSTFSSNTLSELNTVGTTLPSQFGIITADRPAGKHTSGFQRAENKAVTVWWHADFLKQLVQGHLQCSSINLWIGVGLWKHSMISSMCPGAEAAVSPL